MSIYDLGRIQEMGAWVEEIRPLPPAIIGRHLISKAQEVFAKGPESHKAVTADRLDCILNPELAAQRHQEREGRQLTLEIESWLESKEWEPEGETEAEDTDYFEQEYRYQQQAMLHQQRVLGAQEELAKVIREAEFGINFGERPSGGPWHDHDTMDYVRRAIKLQHEIGLPIVGDKIVDIVRDGINSPFNGYAAQLLVRQAAEYDDYSAFLEAGRKYAAAVHERMHTGGSEQGIIEVAARFINNMPPDEFDRKALEIALNALAHYDPAFGFYPLVCARLGVALKRFSGASSVKTESEVVE